MGGQDSTRGYLIQAIIAISRSLDDSTWTTISIEPNDEDEKVDVAWDAPAGRRRIQVKSTRNSFTKGQIERVAQLIYEKVPDDDVELVLVGSTQCDVKRCKIPATISIPQPKNNDIEGLSNEAAFLLAKFCSLRGRTVPPPSSSKLIVDGLTSLVLKLGTTGRSFHRDDFENHLADWLGELSKSASCDAASDATDETFFQRKPRNRFFSGRGSELERIERLLKDADQVCIIGLGGIGKSQLVTEFAYRHSHEYSAIIWIDSESRATVDASIFSWAVALGIVPSESSEQDALTVARKWLKSNHGWLVILDNIEHFQTLDCLNVATGAGKFLATTRRKEVASLCTKTITLECLDADESVRFLIARTSRADCGDHELKASQSLAKELGGLPLALEQAASYITATDARFVAYLKKYNSAKIKLLEKEGPRTGGYSDTVATVWLLNVEEVKERSLASYEVLEVLCFLLPDHIPQEFFAVASIELGGEIANHLSEFFPSEDETLLDELFAPLIQLSLLSYHPSLGTVSVHRLVQQVTHANLSPTGMKTLRQRILKAFLASFPSVDSDLVGNCSRLVQHAIRVISEASDEELLNEYSGLLLHRIGQFAEYRGNYVLAVSINHQALLIRSKVHGPINRKVGVTANNFGVALEKAGYPRDAIPVFRNALSIRIEALGENHSEVAQSKQNLAKALSEIGNYPEAIKLLEEALFSYRNNADDIEGLTHCLGNTSSIYSRLSDFPKAETLTREVLELRENLPGADRNPLLATTLRNLAVFEIDHGNSVIATDLVERAKSIVRRALGEVHPDFASCMIVEAAILAKSSKNLEAISIYRSCVELLRYTVGEGHPLLAEPHVNMSKCLWEVGQREEATKLLQESLVAARKRLGEDSPTAVTIKNNLAWCFMESGRGGQAVRIYQEVRKWRVQTLGWNCNDVGVVLSNLAICYWRLGEMQIARQYFEQAYNVYAAMQFPGIQDCERHLQHFSNFLAGQCDFLDSWVVSRRMAIPD